MHDNIKICALTKSEVYHKLYFESQGDAYTSYLRGIRCKTEDDFLIEVSASFQFPYYYGENWPAFDECINDLEWLKFKKIFIVFDDFSLSFREQEHIQKKLQDRIIRYFTRAIEYWESEGKTVELWLNN
jgi:RNAse (barnase) inhibitor barstar